MIARKRFSHAGSSLETITAVQVPFGQFALGSDRVDESPVAALDINAFWIGRYPVTNAQFAWFIRDGGYKNTALWMPEGLDWLRGNTVEAPAFWDDSRFNSPTQPVTGVSFHEAAAFSRWFGGRLPTEAEWEAAGRGLDARTFPWGEDSPTLGIANFAPDFVPSSRAPAVVTEFTRNISPFGCRQMAGNVFEWCADFYHFDTPRHRGGLDFIEKRPSHRRVLKGGAWTTGEDRIRLAARWSYTPDLRDNILGFRLVFDV